MTDQHQTCKNCGRVQRFEYAVKDEVWAASGCKPGDTFCIECWLLKADHVIEKLTLDDFTFLGIAGYKIHGILHDAVKTP